MNTTTKTGASKKSRMLLVLPMIALPFLALIFWALGGGRPKNANSTGPAGINASLPDAQLPDDSAMDKMSFYEQEEKATDKSGESNFEKDSFGLMSNLQPGFEDDMAANNPYNYGGYSNRNGNTGFSNSSASASEKEIRLKMQQLQDGLKNAAAEDELSNSTNSSALSSGSATESTPITGTNTDLENDPDPEMDKLQSMMNRIYDIQHPDEVNSRLQKESEATRGKVFPVNTFNQPDAIHLLRSETFTSDTSENNNLVKSNNGFFGLVTKKSDYQSADRGIKAVVQENTTIVNGASIKLRLLQTVYINGIPVPAGNFLTGQTQISNDRIVIDVTSILYNQHLFGVKLTAYDTDGMQGLYVPGSINREVLKQSGDNAMQGIGIGTLDPSIGAQAAAAGIETAKTLFSRKLKLTKVFVKSGYKITLRDNQQ